MESDMGIVNVDEFFILFLKILFIHERHREREAEGEAGSMQGA